MACACAQGKQLWKFWEMGTLTQCWPWLSLSPSFLPQAGAELETPASHRIKSEYSQLLLVSSSFPSFSIATSCVPSALCSLNLLCPLFPLGSP